MESAKIIAVIARLVRDVGLAEDLAHDALLSAMERWPQDGMPDNPAAWLMATAKNRALDKLKQNALHRRKQESLAADLEALGEDLEADFSDAVIDRHEI